MCTVGDTSVRAQNAGVFAEGQATVVAAEIGARLRGSTTQTTYDGRGICYMEFGKDMIAKVEVTFTSGQTPAGHLDGPSTDLAARQDAFADPGCGLAVSSIAAGPRCAPERSCADPIGIRSRSLTAR